MCKKVCIKCGEEKSLEEFHKRKSSKDGHRNECSKCLNSKYKESRKKTKTKYYKNNREEILKKTKKYRLENIDIIRIKENERSKNKNLLKKKIRNDILNNKKKCTNCLNEKFLKDFLIQNNINNISDECNICRKNKNMKTYYEKNKKELIEKKEEWKKKNPEKLKAQTKRYYEKNKLEINKRRNKKWRTDYNREYSKKRKKEDILFYIKSKMRTRLHIFLDIRNITKKNQTFKIVGCTPEELKVHLENQFTEGMSWDNKNLWHIDHILPLSSAKTEEEIYKLCHYSNLQPLWAEDNLKKGSKIL
jgi:hypothetical protein